MKYARLVSCSAFALSAGLVIALAAPLTAQATSAERSEHAVCGPAAAGAARCHAHLVDARASSTASAPGGYNPVDLQSAYNLPSSSAGTGQTVAIVDAYDDPNAESDL